MALFRVGGLISVVVDRRPIDQNQQMPVTQHDLLGAVGARVLAQHPACGGIQRGDRSRDAQCRVDHIGVRDQSSGQVGGPTLQRPQRVVPLGNRTFPKQHAIETIPRDQLPIGRQLRRSGRSFVQDAEHPALGRHHGRYACHVVVMATPARPTLPLEVLQRPDATIL